MPYNANNSDSDKTLVQLIDVYHPYISKRAAAACSVAADREDLEQEGFIGLVAAIDSFDRSKGVLFSTYAYTCINNSINSAVRAASRLKHQPLNSSLPLSDETVVSSVPPVQSAEDQAISNEDFCVLQNKISSALSATEQRVLGLKINNRSNIEIAELLGVSAKSVSNAVERARRKLREYMPK